MSSQLLPIFSQLWNPSANVRIHGGAALVAHLQAAQSEHLALSAVPSLPSSVSANIDANIVTSPGEHGLASDVVYALKRLIRGLASPRESSRLGFAVALTEILARIPDIPAAPTISQILSTTEVHPATHRGAEERDLLFARLFGLHALVASGILLRSVSASPPDVRNWQTVIEETLVLGDRKPWLHESAGWVVREAAFSLLAKSANDITSRDHGLQIIVNNVFAPLPSADAGPSKKAAPEWTSERLAMAIMLKARSSHQAHIDWTPCATLKPALPNSETILSSKNLPGIARILRGLPSIPANAGNKANDASSAFFGNGQLHYVWSEIIDAYFPASAAEDVDSQPPQRKKAKIDVESLSTSDNVSFETFFKIIVDESLLGPTASTASKYTGLLAVQALLCRAGSQELPAIITPNLLRTLTNHLVKPDRALHNLSRQVSATLPTAIARCPASGYDVLLRIVAGPAGSIRFDAATRTKTVEGIVAVLDDAGVQQYITWLEQFILHQSAQDTDDIDGADGVNGDHENSESMAVDTKAVDGRRAWAIDQMLLLARRHFQSVVQSGVQMDAAPSERHPSWLLRILNFMATHGFFLVRKTSKKSNNAALKDLPSVPFSTSTQSVFRSRLFSTLSHLVSVSAKCSGQYWSSKILETLRALGRDDKHVQPLLEVSDALQEHGTRAEDLVLRLKEKTNDSQAMPLLFLFDVVLLLARDPEEKAGDNLEELCDAAERLIFDTPPAQIKKPAADESDEEGEEAESISVLVDLLVQLLQTPSALLRTTCERVFAVFTGDIKEQAMTLLLDQIQPDSEQLPADGDDAEDASEVIEAEGTSNADSSNEDEDDEDNSVDEFDEDDIDGMDLELVDPELRDKVAAALKGAGVGEEDEGNDDNESKEDDEEELMDDEQMLQLDEQLAEIFRSRTNASKDQRAEQENSLNARLKTLDLLEIYAKQQPASPLLLPAVLTLFNTARLPAKADAEISGKAARILRNIVNKPKAYPTVDHAEDALPILTAVHIGARRLQDPDLANLATDTAVYLTRIALSESGDRNADAVSHIWEQSLTDFAYRKKSQLHKKFFQAYHSRFSRLSWRLADQWLSVAVDPKADSYSRAQAFTLFADLLSSKGSLKIEQARAEVMSIMPRVVQVYIETFAAIAKSAQYLKNIGSIRSILDTATQAVRKTEICCRSSNTHKEVSEVWRAEELNSVLHDLRNAAHIAAAKSVVPLIRKFTDLVHKRKSPNGVNGVSIKAERQSKKSRKGVDANASVVTASDAAAAADGEVASTKGGSEPALLSLKTSGKRERKRKAP